MRRQKRNTQKKNILAVLFIIAIIATTIVAGSSLNRTNKLSTSIDGAADAVEANLFTPDEVIKSGVEVALGANAYDCSGYIEAVMNNLGTTGIINSTAMWQAGTQTFTYNGVTYSPTLIASGTRATGQNWYDTVDTTSGTAFKNLIKPGDFIAGDNHIILYVGKYDNGLDAVHTDLETISGRTFTLGGATGQLNSRCFDFSACYGPYYYIAGNVPPIRPRLENYEWDDSNGDPTKPDSTFVNLKIYRVAAERPQEYKGGVGLYKYVDVDESGSFTDGDIPLSGAKFKLATAETGGEYLKKDGQDYEVPTGADGYAYFNDIDLGTDTQKIYYLEETFVPNGYVGMTGRQKVVVDSNFNATDVGSFHKIGNSQIKNTGKVGVYKYEDLDGDNEWDPGEPALSGARFGIATTEANARAGTFVKTGVTGQDGKVLFDNLDLGTDTEKTYYLVETESPTGFRKMDGVLPVTAKKDGVNLDDISTLVSLGNTKKIYDLALRKYITAVKDGATGEETEVTNRAPKVTVPENFNTKDCTTLKYDHPKDPVAVHTTDIVTYYIEVFNEGPEDAYSEITKDDIPAGLEFLPDSEVNQENGWIPVDENDNPVDDLSKAKYIITDALGSAKGEKNLIKAFDPETMVQPDSKVVKVQFKVTEPTTSDRILINSAQIAKETDSNGNVVTDRDSTPNEWKGEDDEDIEKVRVLYFDLALRKWVTEAIVTKDGNQTVYQTGHKAEDDPESIVKVDLKKSDLSKVTVKFRYKIRITNQGQIAGEAKVVRDDVPAGLKFMQEDNPNWKEENGKIVTEQLANVTLQPGESTEMEIILTWINGEDNLAVKTNVSEIEKDHNAYGTKDIDSTPGNNKKGEDDIDDAPVMLAIKTGSEIIKYVALAVGLIAFIGISGMIIKKRVLNY